MACTLDQSQTQAQNGNRNMRWPSSSRLELAQRFLPTQSGTICRVDLEVGRVGTPTGNNWVKVYSDNSGTPGTLLGSSDNVAVDGLNEANTYVTFSFTTQPSITASTYYWVSWAGDYTLSSDNFIQVYMSYYASIPSAGEAQVLVGTTWSVAVSNYLMSYKQYYSAPTTNIKAVSGVAYANINKVLGVAKANVKKIEGLA